MDGPLGAMNGGRESAQRLAPLLRPDDGPCRWIVFSGRLMTPQSAGNVSQVEMLFRLPTLFVQLARCYDRLPLSRAVYMAHRGGSETIKTIRQLVLFRPDEKLSV